jgi:hypothetical protein
VNYDRRIVGWLKDMDEPKAINIDVYSVLVAFSVTCPATAHATKKLLCAGQRGHKDRLTDLREARSAIERAIQLEECKDKLC